MANFYREPDRRQRFLLPVDMSDWVCEADMVHLLLDAIELVDLSAFEAHYTRRGVGAPPFSPSMMVCVLIYADANGHRSSRKIERLCERDAGFRMIVGDEVPDHSVIARFRKRHRSAFEALFAEVLKLCHSAGLVRLGVVALDGTKVKANVSLSANRTAGPWRRRWRPWCRRPRPPTRPRTRCSATSGATNSPPICGPVRGARPGCVPAWISFVPRRIRRLPASRRRSTPARPRRKRPASASAAASRGPPGRRSMRTPRPT
ncbi:transposase [Tistrella bauzanensis]